MNSNDLKILIEGTLAILVLGAITCVLLAAFIGSIGLVIKALVFVF